MGKKIATLRFHKRSKGTTLFFDTFSSFKVDCTSETDFRPLNSQTTMSAVTHCMLTWDHMKSNDRFVCRQKSQGNLKTFG